MVQPQSRRTSALTKHTLQPKPSAYRLKGDAVKVLSGLKLPRGAEVAILAPTAAVDSKLRKLDLERIAPWGEPTEDAAAGSSAKAHVDTSAFEPDARARAVLRGLEFARQDLREAGGAYDLEQVRTLLGGVSRQAVGKRVQEGSLLAVPGPNGRRGYPTFQFSDDGSVVNGLRSIQDALPSRNPWFVLNFLTNPQDALDGRKPIDVLRDGDVDSVANVARRVGVQGA